ncbi:hypothetical protein HG264_05520 [Pseudomonas sp. gcc21]|nr:hypothetical protein HG264_05520 [Pseudomonas sp. gcc21]
MKPGDGNEYPRLKAWEFIYEYIWNDERSWQDLIGREQIDTTALHIGFYLANWGMFRGSSGLLQNSNLDLMKTLARLLFSGRGLDVLELGLDDFASGAPGLKENQQNLDALLQSLEALSSNVSWTTTLKTKILMGVWGQFPALDRFYVAACRDLFPRRAFITTASGKGLTALATLLEEQSFEIPSFSTATRGLPYPTARVIDMALFEYGLQLGNARVAFIAK